MVIPRATRIALACVLTAQVNTSPSFALQVSMFDPDSRLYPFKTSYKEPGKPDGSRAGLTSKPLDNVSSGSGAAGLLLAAAAAVESPPPPPRPVQVQPSQLQPQLQPRLLRAQLQQSLLKSLALIDAEADLVLQAKRALSIECPGNFDAGWRAKVVHSLGGPDDAVRRAGYFRGDFFEAMGMQKGEQILTVVGLAQAALHKVRKRFEMLQARLAAGAAAAQLDARGSRY